MSEHKDHKANKLVVILMSCLLGMFMSDVIAKTCKEYSNCRQAVVAWCAGKHPRADGDKDGIPCENVCRSLEQVEKIKREIGC